MDINLPGMNGIECIRQVKDKIPGTQFMMFTVYENDEKVFEALKAGASGYLLKNTGLVQLIESLKELHNGGSPMSANIARKLVTLFRSGQKETANVERLVPGKMKYFCCLPKACSIRKLLNNFPYLLAQCASIFITSMKSYMCKIELKLSIKHLEKISF